MIVEMIVARGWQVWIDGIKPSRDWILGEDGEVGHWKPGTIGPTTPLEIGTHRIVRVRMEDGRGQPITFTDDWEEERQPHTLSLDLDTGKTMQLPITFLVFGCTQAAIQPRVTTLDDKSHDINEITVYIRAESKEAL